MAICEMTDSLITETELPGRLISADTLEIIAHRYFLANQFISGQKVLEVGCGPGLGLGYLSEKTKTVIGGDITWESLRLARKHYGPATNLLQMDAHKLPFKEASLDTIICLAAIIYINMPLFLKECRRVLKQGGTLIVNTPNKDAPGFKPSSLSRCYYSIPELNTLFQQNNFDANFLGAFVAPTGWLKIKSGILSKIIRTLKKWVKQLNNCRLCPNFPSLGGPLRNELTAKEIKLVQSISTKSLSPDNADNTHRIIYVLGKVK